MNKGVSCDLLSIIIAFRRKMMSKQVTLEI